MARVTRGAAAERLKSGYTVGARLLASRSVAGLARTRVTPTMLTTSGVSLCIAASALVYFEHRNEWLFFWLGAVVFVIGSVLDILDGALARDGNETALAFTFAALAGSFLVSYTRSKAEALGLRGDVGIGSRAERVVMITAGLVFAPWGGLQWAIYALAATAWVTVLQRILHVRRQLRRNVQGQA